MAVKRDLLNGYKVKVSHRFVTALSIVSIIGFSGIVSKTLFNFNIDFYVEALWMIIVGIGLIAEVQFRRLKNISKEGLTQGNFNNITTSTVGLLALLAGVLSFPGIRVENQAFLAVKGIVSVIAIIIIILETWVIKRV